MLTDRPSLATILVVDDQEAVSRLLIRWLEHLGFPVLVAGSGEQALCMVRYQRPPADLILADVHMPGMNGLELATWVLTEYPGRQMILMARHVGQGDDSVRVCGRLLPVLPKPLDLDTLLTHLRIMLPPLLPAEEAETPRQAVSRQRPSRGHAGSGTPQHRLLGQALQQEIRRQA
ncbi:MAG TPA: response regulator [Gemmatimonadales bacterium]|jgi:CheY-like chemotaxis protein